MMEFIYAESLKQQYNILGHFYDLHLGAQEFHCRSELLIVAKELDDVDGLLADAVVIMMNPGSSRPLDRLFIPEKRTLDQLYRGNGPKIFVPTRPDNAQYQIMRVMSSQNWQFVRVLNLSDLRNGNSSNFSLDFKQAEKLDSSHPHSIFHTRRHDELLVCLSMQKDAPVITAWGAMDVLLKLASEALQRLSSHRIVGIPFGPAHPWYRYPSPYKKDQKMIWLQEILFMLNDQQCPFL